MILFTVINGSPPKRAPIKLDESLIARIGMDDEEAFLELYQNINQPSPISLVWWLT